MAERVALVIGNAAYEHVPELRNPKNDAEAIADVLKELDFKVVLDTDVDRDSMEDILYNFEQDIPGADAALFFFAGHGLQVQGQNYLIPVDAEISLESHLKRRTFLLADILGIMEGRARKSLIFLDACRDNPFARSLARGIRAEHRAPMNVRSGLAEVSLASSGSFIAFATSPDSLARDGLGSHSPFTEALLDHIRTPGVSVGDMMIRVGNSVDAATNHQQTPWVQSTIREVFYFKATNAPKATEPAIETVKEPTVPSELSTPSRGRKQPSDPASITRRTSPLEPLNALDPKTFNDTSALHCLVVAAELEQEVSALDRPVRLALESRGTEIEAAADEVRRRQGSPITAGAGNSRDRARLVRSLLAVEEVFTSAETLKAAVVALCRADVAVFDITRLQPGIMLLLGVRSVARRGVTICSYGDQYIYGQDLRLPFNLQMLNVAAHSHEQGRRHGLRASDIIGRKIVRGLKEMAGLPECLDLPAFDAVRTLGASADSFEAIPPSKKVLVLCPFSAEYEDRNWRTVSEELYGKLKSQLHEGKLSTSGTDSQAADEDKDEQLLVRLLDVETPRLVVQTLYQLIRRVDMCVVDWTGLRPNVMFELGVRLAVNRLGGIHIAETTGSEERGPKEAKGLAAELTQVRDLRRLMRVFEYSCEDGDAQPFVDMVTWFDEGRRPRLTLEPQESRYCTERAMDFLIYETIGEAIGQEPQSGAPPIFDELVTRAQLLSHAEEESIGRSSVLYNDVNPHLRSRAQAAATERRIAAWLYIDARHTNEEIVADPELLQEFRALAAQVRLWFNKQRKEPLLDERDKRINDRIVRRMNELLRSAPSLSPAELSAELAILKDEAKLLRDDGKYEGAIEQLIRAIALIDASRWNEGLAPNSSPSDVQKKMAWHLADCLGMIGGNYRRKGQLEDAIKCFERGSEYERDPRYQLLSSYNMVNAIVAPIEGGMRDATSQASALHDAVAALKRQIDPDAAEASRRMDRWAWADLGQCCLLLGRLDEARAAYERFMELSDPASIRSSCQVLENLQHALKAKGDEKAATIDDIVKLLKSAAKETAMGGPDPLPAT